MEREYTVIVTAREHLADIEAEITASSGAGPIPNRAVDIANARPGSKIQTHFMLTDEEAEALRADSRVRAVEIPPEQRDDISLELHAAQSGNFFRGDDSDASQVNWGIRRSIEATNVYSGSTTISGDYLHALTGSGIDIVIQDSGVDADHPEWDDADGNSRFQQIDWYAASGFPGSQDQYFYTDYDGHGTHCAGIAAGKTYGWAKDAHIYGQKLAGLEGISDPGVGISISNAFDMIRLWHNNKTNGRPTVVNMSWGYGSNVTTTDPTSGIYRGTPWTFAGESQPTLWANYGIVSQVSNGVITYRRFPAQIVSVDAEIEDMIADGIHVCIAAGNDYYKADLPAGADYNNSVLIGGNSYFYHRPSSPYSPNAFIVGNIDSVVELDGGEYRDKTAGSSKKGPAVNIWAPGTDITSTTSITNKFTDYPYPGDSNYKITNISGTSMASPQVCGLIALYLESTPDLTPAQMQEKLFNDSKSVIHETANNDSDYTSYETSIMGSPNRILYSRYGVLNPFTITGT
jgi:subtilisin family serine protease